MLSQTQKLSKCKSFLNIYYTNIRDIKLNSYLGTCTGFPSNIWIFKQNSHGMVFAMKIPEFELLNWLNTNTSRNKKESTKKPKRVKRKTVNKEELGKFEIIAKKMGQDLTFSEPISDLKKKIEKTWNLFLEISRRVSKG